MKRIFMFTLLILSISVLALSLEEIRDISKEDPTRAFVLLMRYLKEHPDDEEAMRLGRVISAKKALAKIPEISKAAVKEDVDELIDGLAKMKDVSVETMRYIELIFPNFYDVLRRRFMELDERAFKVCEKIPERVREPEGFAEKIVEEYFKKPLEFDPSFIKSMKCLNITRIKSKIKGILQEKVKDEDNYLKVLRFSEMMGVEPPYATDLRAYSNLLQKLGTIDVSKLSSEDFKELYEEYESINLKKSSLADKLKSVYLKLPLTEDLSFCTDPDVCPPVRSTAVAKESALQSQNKETKPATINLRKGFDDTWKTVVLIGTIVLITTIVVLIAIKMNDPRRKIAVVKKKIAKDPSNPQLHLKLASLLEEIGRIEEAMEEYRLAYKLFSYEKESSGNNRS